MFTQIKNWFSPTREVNPDENTSLPSSFLPPVDLAEELVAELDGIDLNDCQALERGTVLLKELAEMYRQPAPLILSPDAKIAREKLLAYCKIEVLSESQVALTLPKGLARIDFLQKVQAIAKEMYGRAAIYPARLEAWAADKAFAETPDNTLAIDGNVHGSTERNRGEQESFLKDQKPPLQMPELRDLAIAHAAYFLATGKDLFNGYWVRARGGAFGFHGHGLNVNDSYDDFRSGFIAAATLLPGRN